MEKNTAEYQRAVGAMVDRDVYANISGIVYRMSETGDEAAQDLFTGVPDYEAAAIESGWAYSDISGVWYRITDGTGTKRKGKEYGGAEECCSVEGIEPHWPEVYEHYIVSLCLAEELEAKGEKVDHDFYGQPVWARTCSGQAIMLDSVIQTIYDEREAAINAMIADNAERG